MSPPRLWIHGDHPDREYETVRGEHSMLLLGGRPINQAGDGCIAAA